MYRWKMCPKCGIKMQLSIDGENVVIYMCPICKDGHMTISGELLKEVEKVAEATKRDVDEVLLSAVKDMEKYE